MSTRQLFQLAEEAGVLCHWTDAHGHSASLDEQALLGVLKALQLPADTPAQLDASLARARQLRQEAEHGPLLICNAEQPIDVRSRLGPGSHCQVLREDGHAITLQVDRHGYLPALPCGYHQLSCGEQQWQLACAPPACPSIPELTGGRRHIWGIAAQVYSLRRTGDGGLGDTAALQDLVLSAADKGADALAISPLHAMFSCRPEHYSPYSPSSRSLLNILHAAPAQILGAEAVQRALRECQLGALAQTLEQQELIDWPAVSALRLQLLRQLHAHFAEAPVTLREDFQRFRHDGGESLQLHCCHEALQRHMLDAGHGDDWHHWPAPWGQPDSPAVRRFAEEQAAELEFHAFGQWLAARCLAQVQQQARSAGMGIGLISDMAIGADPSGSFGWACQQQLLSQVSIGAPPDLLNQDGQDWGVAAFSPLGLKRNGYSAFIAMLRANLAQAGGVRIDHVMGLQRLWIIPDGASPQAGAYLNYPLDDLLRLLALESWRHRALIIGEDLGTVPAGLQALLAERNILGMRVLLFEQEDGHMPAAHKWSAQALATTGTHDLPTLSGWLDSRDINWRLRANERSPEQARHDRQVRDEQVNVLDAALQSEGLLDENAGIAEQLDAGIRFLGRTPAPLVLVPLEDIMGSEEQPNLPGSAVHPNWRRRWPQPAADMLDAELPRQRLQHLQQERQGRERNPSDE